MKNYVLIYDNGGFVGDKPMDEILKDWGVWFEELGSKLVDGGNPFNNGAKKITKDGVSDVEKGLSGYSIVKVASMDEAVELAKGCPMLIHSPKAVVQVYETLPM
jgi:hypothetical protein